MESLRAFYMLATCSVSFAVVQFAVDQTYLNHRLPGYVDSTHEGLPLARCSQKCGRVPSCLSINYEHATQTCEMNTVTSATAAPDLVDGWVFSNIDEWPQDLFGNCGSNPCPNGEECVPSDSGPLCYKGCGPVPEVDNATTFDIPSTPVFGSTAGYECVNGTVLVNETSDTTLTCLGRGAWSTPQFQCA